MTTFITIRRNGNVYSVDFCLNGGRIRTMYLNKEMDIESAELVLREMADELVVEIVKGGEGE